MGPRGWPPPPAAQRRMPSAQASCPSGIPLGVALLGLGIGMLNALGAVGLILIYRAGRYVNFAQASVGAAAASFTFRLIAYKGWNWYLAVALGLMIGIALAGLCELVFIQRLFTASRLVVTIATIGIAQFATFFGLLASNVIKAPPNQLGLTVPNPPFKLAFDVGPVRFGSAFVLIFCVVPVVLGAFALFMKKSRYGIVIEAGAQNVDRARLVGISVRGLSTVVWLLVGFLGALGAILAAPVTNLDVGTSAGASQLLYALAPAMIAGLDGIVLAVVAALGLGIVQQALAFNYTSSGPIQLTLFLVIVAVLFLRRQKLGVGGRVQEAALTMGGVIHPFPRELRGDRLLQLGRLSGRLACLAIAVVAPLFMSLAHLSLASVIVAYGLAALSLTVLTGYTGQVSFGQWAFAGFGGLLAGHLAVAARARLLAGPRPDAAGRRGARRRDRCLGAAAPRCAARRDDAGVRGRRVGLSVRARLVRDRRLCHAPDRVRNPPLRGAQLLLLCLVIFVLVFIAVGRIGTSTLGRNMAAVRDQSRVASAYGISVFRTRLVAFAISGFIASLAGYLYLYNEQQLNAAAFRPERVADAVRSRDHRRRRHANGCGDRGAVHRGRECVPAERPAGVRLEPRALVRADGDPAGRQRRHRRSARHLPCAGTPPARASGSRPTPDEPSSPGLRRARP